MLCIPAVTARDALRERGVLAFQRRVGSAHDALAQVFEAVRNVACHLVVDYLSQQEAVVDLQNVVQAVELVSHACGEDSANVLITLEWVREIVVLGRFLDV